MPEFAEEKNARAFKGERNEHRILSSDTIRDPAEEGAGEAVENAIEGQREGQSRKRNAQKRHGVSAILKSTAIGPSWATAISPPAAIMTNIRYMSQNSGALATSKGPYCGRPD